MRKYKLILADDEEEVRSSILEKVQWKEYGFEQVESAENGKEALELVDKILPDVVITDIKMPYMDGMELAKAIREKYPSTKIIVLTGFDEFQFAQKAIKLNVMEYVLKPISANELIDVLIRVKSRLDQEIAEKENIEALRENYRKSLPILKEKFLTSLVTNTLSKEEIEEKSKNYGVDLSGNCFVVAAVSIDHIMSKYLKDNEIHEGLYREKELLKFAVLNMVEETVNKYNLGTSFFDNEHIVVLGNFKETTRTEAIKQMGASMEEIRQNVQRFLKVTVTIGVGNVFYDVVSVSRSYEDAVTALDYKLFMGNNKVIFIEDIEPKSRNRIIFDEIKEHSLASSIKLGSMEEVEATIDTLFEKVNDFNTSYKDYQVYLIEILTTILKTARNSDADIDEIFGTNHNLFSELTRKSNKEEVISWLKEISILVMKHIAKNRQDTCELIVEQAKNYVAENYHSSDISINSVCDYLHISATYFSFIFKRGTKMTFINYLTQVRMEAAKELLRTTNMKSFEIADKVGYLEPNYFSYSFKKKFQVSPSEYRNSFKNIRLGE